MSKITRDTPEQQASVTTSRKLKFQWVIQLAKQLAEDVKRAARRSQQLCPLCFYSPAIGGRAVTSYWCLRCNKQYEHGNTEVPTLCLTCAHATEQCCQCGANIEYREKANEAPSLPKEPKANDL